MCRRDTQIHFALRLGCGMLEFDPEGLNFNCTQNTWKSNACCILEEQNNFSRGQVEVGLLSP